MDIRQALELMDKLAKESGAEQYDILAGDTQDMSVQVYKAKVKTTELSTSCGIGIRLFLNGRPGYSFTRKLSPEAISNCVKDAADLSQFSAPVDFTLPNEAPTNTLDLKLWNDELEKLSTEHLLALSFELEKKAEKAHKTIENVLSAAAGKSSSTSYFLNSKGLFSNHQRNSVMAGVSLVAAKGDIKKSGGFYKSLRDFNFPVDLIVQEACSKAVDLLDAKPIATGEYPVMFDNHMAPGMIGSFIPALYAESVQKGQSKLAGKIGETIAASCLHIYNDPFLPHYSGSGFIDSEGVLTSKFDVIKDGKLLTYLYNLETAAKEKCPPTGTGSRSYTGKAGTGFDNMMVSKGSRSRQEILNSLEKCLLITKFEGSGIRSSVSGEISIGCQGFLYSHGKKIQAVDRITICGNYMELLQNIQEFSNEYADNFSSSKVPDMLIRSMSISG